MNIRDIALVKVKSLASQLRAHLAHALKQAEEDREKDGPGIFHVADSFRFIKHRSQRQLRKARRRHG